MFWSPEDVCMLPVLNQTWKKVEYYREHLDELPILNGIMKKRIEDICIELNLRFFDTNKWSINQPIILSQVENCISCANVNGVAAVKNIEFTNKAGGIYSPYTYDLPGATLGGIIYPSLDPMIFEIRYPDSDILGRVVGA